MTTDTLHAFLGPHPGLTLFTGFLMANLAVGPVILMIAAARRPMRRALGPAAAYALWGFLPVAGLAALLLVFIPVDSGALSFAAATQAPHSDILVAIWALGAAGMAVVFAVAQLRFLAEVRAGRAGPAVYGLIAPRIVMPADDGTYTTEERDLIRAHEREHVARKDPRAAAAAAVGQCLCWFNPLAHLAAEMMRLDQELACDAAVVMRRPGRRALYARTLMKTQLASQPLPFGCYWPARGRHPLEVRIELLKPRAGASAAPAGSGFVLPLADAIRP